MTYSRWDEACKLVEQALDLPEADRAEFLKKACGDDQELLRKAEDLLALPAAEFELITTRDAACARSDARRILEHPEREDLRAEIPVAIRKVIFGFEPLILGHDRSSIQIGRESLRGALEGRDLIGEVGLPAMRHDAIAQPT